ncbi:zinc finger domain-containing protein relative of woc [Arctopsyche grandis]|uniref:zinc finger domain-containing protein relative of woc n=1 Tax=Arctopsyche grandis TaxID=121162 RepID=UPI00406D8C3E
MKLKRAKRDRDANREVVAAPEPPVHSRFYFGPDEPTLQLECWEEDLSPAQLQAYEKADQEHNTIKNKLSSIVKESGGEVLYTGEECTAYTVQGKAPGLSELATPNTQPVTTTVKKEHGKKKGKKEKEKEPKYVAPPTPPSPEPKHKENKKSLKALKEKSLKTAPPAPATNVQSVSSGVRPSEASAIGGLATGSNNKNAIVDLTKDDLKNAPDSREVAFNKLQGKTFPSLVVVARPYLRTKEGSSSNDRTSLDSKVKSVLMHTPTKFTEWLIQQGLVRSEQLCAIHSGNKLKLGMYSDVSKFPYSGGYVWISECCPARFVSVFSGSLFEGATHPPSVLLKLIYHWACQTNVQNVVQWVKVDNLYVKGLFTWLRAACTAALHHHMTLMGGSGRRIEVGVISLGTTSHDGLQRQVKVEVLGILDADAKLVRLRAVEPLADGERNYKKRFQKILEPLAQWVHPDSIILTDLTVDKGTLLQMGFKTVHQVSNNEPSKNSNINIMEYLRRIVPRMFQNTLSLLSRQIIQQFLDELVWREWYGTSPGLAFDNIVLHLAEQTRLDTKDNLVFRLNKISSNPFKNWRYANFKPSKTVPSLWVETPPPKEAPRRGRRRKESPPPSPAVSPSPPSPPLRRSLGGKETRKRKRVNYIEPDDEDDVILMESKKDKKLKKQIEEKKVYEEPKKKESKKKEDKKKEEKKKDGRKEKKKDKEEIKLSIKKETKDDPMVDLEKFYFGEAVGDKNECRDINMFSQCPECSLDFDKSTNLQLHLFSHVFPNIDPTSVDINSTPNQCRYCLNRFDTQESLNEHLLEIHPLEVKSEGTNAYCCVLCEIGFNSLSILSSHMQKTHVPSELPYSCGLCGYRVSCHRSCIDHFYNEHQNSATMQCPYCLKVIKAFADGCDLQANIEFLLQHLQKHQGKQNSFKCNRCALKFVHLGTLREHQILNHSTIVDAKPLCSSGYLICKPKNKATLPVKDSANHLFTYVFDNMTLSIPDGFLCKECDSQLEDDKHFLGTCRCSKCSFQTSCWRSLLQHSGMCSENKTRGQRPMPLSSSMHCICSYSSDDGNDLAQHLALCERQSAYYSEEQAKLNTVPVSTTKHGMMDSLGLQRNKDSDYGVTAPQVDIINDYPAPPSVLNTQLSLDDLAPPSVLQHDQMELEQMKNEAYEQPLATPCVQHEEMDLNDTTHIVEQQPMQSVITQGHSEPLSNTQSLDSYMDSTGEFEPLPAEPMPQPEFEPL